VVRTAHERSTAQGQFVVHGRGNPGRKPKLGHKPREEGRFQLSPDRIVMRGCVCGNVAR